MISGITSGSSSLQSIKALNAFKMDEKIVQKNNQQLDDNKEEFNLQTEIKSDKLRDDISQFKAHDIKQYAQAIDMNITNSDINYGMTYGRSVIVDYSA